MNVVLNDRDSNTFISSMPCQAMCGNTLILLSPWGGIDAALIFITFPVDIVGEPSASGGTNGFTRI